MPHLTDDVSEYVDRQHGVLTRRQLLECGVTMSFVKAQLEGRRWQALNESVVVCHNGPLTRPQQAWTVVLSAPGPAAVCAVSALEMWGMRTGRDDRVHVLVPRGARVLPTPGVPRKVHESRRFRAEDVWPVPRPAPVTAAPRAALDAAVWERSSRAAVRIIVDAVQQRICSAAAIRAELERAGRVRHRRLLGQVLADVDGGAEAVSELAFLAFCRRHDLPTPRLQVRLDSAGRRRYLDADFPRPGRRPLRVEVDGGVHLTLRARWKDTRKDNDAALDGELVLRFPSVAIYTDDPEAVAQLRRGLALSAAERVIAS